MNKPRVSDESRSLVAKLRSYNTPDRTIEEQRHIAADIHSAADAIESLRAALAQEREAREQRESDEARLGLVAAEWKPRAERAEAACARMREALEDIRETVREFKTTIGYQENVHWLEPFVDASVDALAEEALASDAGEKAAAVIRAAREWRRSRRTGAEDWPASVDLAAAVDALDAELANVTEYLADICNAYEAWKAAKDDPEDEDGTNPEHVAWNALTDALDAACEGRQEP